MAVASDRLHNSGPAACGRADTVEDYMIWCGDGTQDMSNTTGNKNHNMSLFANIVCFLTFLAHHAWSYLSGRSKSLGEQQSQRKARDCGAERKSCMERKKVLDKLLEGCATSWASGGRSAEEVWSTFSEDERRHWSSARDLWVSMSKHKCLKATGSRNDIWNKRLLLLQGQSARVGE